MLRFILFIFTLLLLAMPTWAEDVILHQAPLGDNFSFNSLKGKWVYINYWANWCEPCLEEIAAFNQFYDSYQHKNIAVFGVNYDGLPINEQLKLIQQAGLHYPSLTTDPADALKLGDIRAIPVTFIFDPTGKLHDVRYGKQTVTSLSNVL